MYSGSVLAICHSVSGQQILEAEVALLIAPSFFCEIRILPLHPPLPFSFLQPPPLFSFLHPPPLFSFLHLPPPPLFSFLHFPALFPRPVTKVHSKTSME